MKKKILENGYLIIAELIFLLKFQDHKNGERLIDLNFFYFPPTFTIWTRSKKNTKWKQKRSNETEFGQRHSKIFKKNEHLERETRRKHSSNK